MHDLVAVIPARAGSKGIKQKNQKKIHGKSLIAHAIDFAMSTGVLDTVIVSSDIPGLEESEDFGRMPLVFHQRSAFAASDTASDFDVLQDLRNAGFLDVAGVVVWLRPTSPIRLTEDFLKCLESGLIDRFSSIRSVSPIPEMYNPFWSRLMDESHLLTPSISGSSYEKYYQRNLLPQAFIPNCQFELVKVDEAFSQGSFYPGPVGGFETTSFGVDINSVEDLESARIKFDLSFNTSI